MRIFFNRIKAFVKSNKKTSVCIAFLIVLAIFFGIYFSYVQRVPLKFLSTLNEDQQVSIGRFIGNAYQHIYGYKTVCKSANVLLTKYPETYKNVAKENLEMLNKILAKDDLNLEGAIYLFLPYESMQVINNTLYRELMNVAGSDEGGLKSACLLLEEQAELVVNSLTKSSNKEFNKTLRNILK